MRVSDRLGALLNTRYMLARNNGPQGHPDLENITQPLAPTDRAFQYRLRMALRVTTPLAVFLALTACSPLLPNVTANPPF